MTRSRERNERPAVLVAGATGAIGSAIARRLAEQGWDVGVGYRSFRDAAESLAEELEVAGASAWTGAADLADPQSAHDLVSSAPRPLSGVVYAAGPPVRLDYAARVSAESFSQVVDDDLKGCFHLFRAAIEPLRVTRGALLAVTTVAVTRYATRDVLSGVPKAGVETLVKAIAVEEGRYGVRANAVAPGLIEGAGMLQTFLANGDFPPEALEAARRNTPLRCFGSAEDIAGAAGFLMSPEARWITGQVLCVDGGYAVA